MTYEITKCPNCSSRVGLTTDNWRCGGCGYVFTEFLRSLKND